MNPARPTSVATSELAPGPDPALEPTDPGDRPAPAFRLPDLPDYEILAELGRGGMGVVYQARDRKLNRLVAVKLVLGGAVASPTAVARFLAEAEALAALEHPHIVRVYDRGRYGDLPYFAMELCPGGSLARRVGDRPAAPREAARLVEQLAAGVAAAHARNILHRDLKPDNVLFAADGTPKITDFGLAKRFDDSDDPGTGLTLSGVVMGTPSYMAPEQAIGDSKRVGPPADVYALGAVLCKLLTGRPPFLAASPAETIRQVVTGDPVSPARLVPTLPRDLVTICLKCLQTVPAHRYASAQELADDLRRFLEGRPIQARPVSTLERARKWVRRNPVVTALAAAAVAALVAGTAVSYLKYRDARAQEVIANRRAKEASDRADERDAALRAEAARVIERDNALADAAARERETNYQLGVREFLLTVAALDGRSAALARDRLARVPVEQRDWEWHYVRRQAEGGIFTARGHTDRVTAVAVSPDGVRMASAGWDNTVRVWGARTGALLHTLRGHTSWVECLAYSPDGSRLVTGGRDDPRARIWDARTGRPVAVLRPHGGSVKAVAFTPDGGRVVTLGDDNTIRVIDVRTGRFLIRMSGFAAEVRGIAVSPDGTRLATGVLSGPATVWDVRTGRVVTRLKCGPEESTVALAFSPDGFRLVTGGGAGAGAVWDARTGTRLVDLTGHAKALNAVAFSPDGRLVATGSVDQTARVWDARTGEPVVELKGHTAEVAGVAFTPDGLRVATASGDRTIKVWDTRTGIPAVELRGHATTVRGVAFGPDAGGPVVTAGGDGTARLWDPRTGKPLRTLRHSGSGGMTCVAVAPDGRRVVTGHADRTATIWDGRTGEALRHLTGHPDRVTAAAFSADGAWLATAGDGGTVKLWDAITGEPRGDLTGHQGAVYGLAFSPDPAALPRLATAGVDRTLRVWDVRAGSNLVRIATPVGAVTGPFLCVAFSPDGSRLAAGMYEKLAGVWDAHTGAPVFDLGGHTGRVQAVAFSPSGRRIVTGSDDRTVRIWDARTGTPLYDLKQPDWVLGLAFSPDGARLAVVGVDATATVYDARPVEADAGELEYRLTHTRSDPDRHDRAFAAARAAGDRFAAAFHLDRRLAADPDRADLYRLRNEVAGDPVLDARAAFHHPALAEARYDREVVRALAVIGDRMARRLVAQQLLQDGRAAAAVPLLHLCLLSRPASGPPVEEFLLAAAYHALGRPDDARRVYAAAAAWLDGPRGPLRAANVVAQPVDPWSAVLATAGPVADPRFLPADWEAWRECEVFRARAGALLRGR